MPITGESTLVDVCFEVCTALDRVGTTAVLTGGSAATFYAPHRYQSGDADFVITISANPPAAASELRSLGFTEIGGIYRHKTTEYTLEFPPGPLAVGADLVTQHATVHRQGEVLHVLTRTDSCRDRLAAFYHWDDRSSLRTAIDVALSGYIDVALIKEWSEREDAASKFTEFLSAYEHKLKAEE